MILIKSKFILGNNKNFKKIKLKNNFIIIKILIDFNKNLCILSILYD